MALICASSLPVESLDECVADPPPDWLYIFSMISESSFPEFCARKMVALLSSPYISGKSLSGHFSVTCSMSLSRVMGK
ncbi:Hypothetical protein GL50581_3090 [Giardia duodenalis ATCC 50581]|uniref:Uncharacterized protein n=1 Tax=Giardia intestinalis (strain ATCC 50581 / GS clone H7) TaxID=598745 RepID=C6LWD2_GIAIB|nr:Hypothetical protein GL50581_3090 [Giardia intestinalis ATCC 50581]